jgi:DNA-binding CsgD family transcriptional regulator/PAS domain-containing protein
VISDARDRRTAAVSGCWIDCMQESEELAQLIGEIYDAALEPKLCSGVVEKAARFIGGSGAGLLSKDKSTNSGNLYVGHGIDPRVQKLYLEKYVRLDLSSAGQLVAETEQPVAMADLMPYSEFIETQFYKEWVRPQGLADVVSAMLDRSATSMAMFDGPRHERDGLVDEKARRRMQLVVPHFRRAVLIGRLFDLKQGEVATFSGIIDGLGAGVFLLDRGGRIVHTNAAARTILNNGDFLRAVSGRIVARDAVIDQALREIISAAASGDDEAGVKGTALPLIADGGQRYVAHVLRLTSGARGLAGALHTAAAALFVRKAALESPSLPELIAKSYKLTPAELRVLLAIVEIGGVPEVAAALGVAATTVKTHLGRLFEKTGVNRQADLVKLVAGFSSPFER